MSSRLPILCLAAAVFAGCTRPVGKPVVAVREETRPNIVLILADDLGWADLEMYGSPFHDTPHLNRLASQGQRYLQAYAASPVCSPTRASLLTGRHPARLQQTDWIPGQGDEPHQPLLQIQDRNALPPSEATLAELLAPAGYATAHIGKWHLGGKGHRPADQGFDVVIGANNSGSPPTYFWPYEGRNRPIEDLTATGEPGENLTDRLGEEAARFIAEHRDRPFFLHLSFYAPHTPLEGKPELVAKYEARAGALDVPESAIFGSEGAHVHRRVQSHPVYAAMVETLDAAVGRVLRSLEENGVAERTIVVFLSDNGGLAVLERTWPALPPTSNLPLRAGKGWLYEGGIRVPMIVRWPGVTPPGTLEDAPITTNDILPTLLEVAGVKAERDVPLDGRSFAPLLRGEEAARGRELFWHYPHYHGSGQRPSSAVRSGDYKLIHWYEDDRVELYDVRRDVSETRDLAGQMPERVAELRERLASWLREVDAQVPVPNPGYTGSPERD